MIHLSFSILVNNMKLLALRYRYCIMMSAAPSWWHPTSAPWVVWGHSRGDSFPCYSGPAPQYHQLMVGTLMKAKSRSNSATTWIALQKSTVVNTIYTVVSNRINDALPVPMGTGTPIIMHSETPTIESYKYKYLWRRLLLLNHRHHTSIATTFTSYYYHHQCLLVLLSRLSKLKLLLPLLYYYHCH